jgi:hypothetical protein
MRLQQLEQQQQLLHSQLLAMRRQYAATVDYPSQQVAVRLSLKVLGCLPDQLGSRLRFELLKLAGASSSLLGNVR